MPVSRDVGHLPSVLTKADLDSFSFHATPILVVEDFWNREERHFFREGMERAVWQKLSDLPKVQANFPNAGNWAKAAIGQAHGQRLLERLSMRCIEDYIESFPNISSRHLSFSYYSYAAGDCLLTHDDTDEGYALGGSHAPLRRLALVSYFHDEWQSDWGGELIIYAQRKIPGTDRPELTITHCIAPRPGSLVIFTVPRFHRVCRVDPVAGDKRRLSIAGWFMTQH